MVDDRPEKAEKREKVLLLGVAAERARGEASLEELAALVASAGGEVVGRALQVRDEPDPRTYAGRGKVAEAAAAAREAGAELLVCDDELTPAQARNLEEATGLAVLDRSGVILDIFARRAHTREGKLQVELAQHLYRLPRLAGRGTSLSRLGGGIGTRGPGETKLEADRRAVRERVAHLRRELAEVRRQREQQRSLRRRAALPVAVLVGYTNAGKSTLRAALLARFAAGQPAEAEPAGNPRLFDTLDPTTRRLKLPGGQEILLTDTVGFVRKLPHTLVAAFRATLEEVAAADLIVHVLDAADPAREEQMEAVRAVLAEIGALERPSLLVANKVDLLADPYALVVPPGALPVSARTGEGVEQLAAAMERALSESRVRARFVVPYNRGELLALLHSRGKVLEERYTAEGTELEIEMEDWLAGRIAAALVPAPLRGGRR
ncbi:MAG: GTPase HflX [Firmicutes bacterium]|nr:GTPase HflX [Bacillota bacterium]